jgi:hypothetical protein
MRQRLRSQLTSANAPVRSSRSSSSGAQKGGVVAKRISVIALGAALVALLVVGLASGADGRTQRHFVLTEHAAYLKVTHGYPSPGGRSLQAGALRMRLGGDVKRGASRQRIEVISITNNVVDFKAKTTAYVHSGSIEARFHGAATFQPDGSATVDAEGRITDGTGAYRDATGRLTGSGSIPNVPVVGTIITIRAEGTIKY